MKTLLILAVMIIVLVQGLFNFFDNASDVQSDSLTKTEIVLSHVE